MIIDVHSDEFADIVMAYLLDMLRDDGHLPDNPRFKHFIKEDKWLKKNQYWYQSQFELP